jgi:ABC-2 type transport system ATP-binding protein
MVTTGKAVIETRNLAKRFSDVQAVAGVDFDVCDGELFGFLGPNGAGKTTTINMVLGILTPDSGNIHIEGMDIAGRRSSALELTNFAAVYAPLPGNLTLYQNLRVFGLMYGVKGLPERINELLEQLDLRKFRDVKCGVLSSGEQTRAGLAKAMLNHPHLLLLDEPTASLDPSSALDIRAKIREFSAQCGSGVLWTSHNMYEVEEVCDRVLFLSHGKILLEGDPRTLPAEHGKETLEELFISVAREPLALGGA